VDAIALKSLAAPELKIVSGTWSALPDYRPVIAYPPQQALPVRALMPNLPTSSTLVEFPVETSFTNNAGYQVAEGDAKGQSDAAYSLTQLPVATIAHWIPVSRQLLDDSTAFSGYVNARLVFMLEKIVEQEILFGSGLTGHLKGIATSASVATETATGLVDSVGGSISQLAAIGVAADGVIANPQDWWSARMSKASTSGNYLIGDPLQAQRPTIFGLTVALAPSMPVGRYLVRNFAQGAAVYDRMQNVVEVSREHSDYFIRNMAAILVEARLAVAVFSPASFVYESTGAGS
jgi:HK97 family phage major capsid protein